MATTSLISAEQREAELERVLGSQHFDRSGQLRSLLSYICREEIAGRGSELSEYRIGVEALSRPHSFLPAEDAVVRNRIYALRKRLEEYYQTEGQAAVLRVEIPKGSYTPRFVAVETIRPTPSIPSEVNAELPPARPSPTRRKWLQGTLLAAAAASVGGVGGYLLHRQQSPQKVANVISRAWGPLLATETPVQLVVATPPSTLIRPYPVAEPGVPGMIAPSAQLQDWYRQKVNGQLPAGLFQVPNINSPLWGDMAAAFRLSQVLGQAGAPHRLIAERLVTPPALRGQNVIFFGDAEYSPAISRLMEKMPVQCEYLAEYREHVVWIRKADGGLGRVFIPKRSASKDFSEVYGLVTVLPAEGDAERTAKYVIISGISSAGSEAAAEYFASPTQLAALETRLGGRWPSAYQVVVHAATNRVIALGHDYAAHEVVDWP